MLRQHMSIVTLIVILIIGASHCANMYSAKDNDPEGLDEARAEIHSIIGQWLTSSDSEDSDDDNSSALQVSWSFVIDSLLFIVVAILIK